MIRKLVFTTLKRRITSDEYAQLLELGSVPATNHLPIYLSIQPMEVALSWAIASTISHQVWLLDAYASTQTTVCFRLFLFHYFCCTFDSRRYVAGKSARYLRLVLFLQSKFQIIFSSSYYSGDTVVMSVGPYGSVL